MDFIVANDVSKDGAGFKTDTNLVTIIDKDGMVTDYPILDKLQVAKIILNKVKELINDKS